MRWSSTSTCAGCGSRCTGRSSSAGPGELAVWEGRGPARSHAHTIYRLRPDGDGTRLDYENEFHAPLGPLGAVASRALVGGIPQREANRSLERLRGLFGEGR